MPIFSFILIVKTLSERQEKSMVVKIRTKNFNSNEGVERVARKELARVEKMFAENTIYDVCVKKERNEANKTVYKCDILIKNGKLFIRGFGEGNTVEASLDAAVDSLKRKARKVKTLAKKKIKEYDQFIAPDYEEQAEEIFNFSIKIERRKEFEALVMTEEEAAIQMELSGHDFFVFRNENGDVSVLYKRARGYGIITAL